jgi:hypothetical protein
VATIHRYHFLGHLSGDDAVLFLREVERVLIPESGVINFAIPYFSSVLMSQNLQHKSFWCEETFRTLFEDDTYENYGTWRLTVHFLMIGGIVNRNLALAGQIIKSDEDQRGEEEWFYPKYVGFRFSQCSTGLGSRLTRSSGESTKIDPDRSVAMGSGLRGSASIGAVI